MIDEVGAALDVEVDKPETKHTAAEKAEQEDCGEARVIKVQSKPRGPAFAEWRQHRATHYPFRSWCPYCVAARTKGWPHRRDQEHDSQ